MKQLNRIATAVALTLGIAATAYAHPGPSGEGMRRGMQEGQHQGMQGAHGQGMHAGKGPQAQGSGENCGMQRGPQGSRHGARGQGNAAPHAAQQLMTPEERTALRDKMRNAATPEERQQLALANRAEMQKRAAEKGVTLPEHRGHRGRMGTPPAAATDAPATAEHAH